MRSRRLSCLLLGAWLGCSLFMGAVAILNFRTARNLLAASPPQLQELSRQIGGDAVMQQVLRYEVAEQNRELFEIWEQFQLAIGVILFTFLLFGTREGKIPLSICLVMLVLVGIMHWAVTPDIIGLGRELDFQDAREGTFLRSQLQSRHVAYSALEFVKLGLGLTLAGFLIWSPNRRNSTRRQLDEMDAYPVR
jgi:hypothetical protein